MVRDALNRSTIFSHMTVVANQHHAVNLSQGIPEALADKVINRAVSESSRFGWQYADPKGLEVLRCEVAAQYSGHFDPDSQVLVTSGCTESLSLALQAAKGHFGNRVAFLEPFYSYYPGLAQSAGLDSVTLSLRWLSGSYAVDMAQLENELQGGTRILLLNTPHNPTGWVLSSDLASEIAQLVERYDALLVLDEVYEDFIYDSLLRYAADPLRSLGARCLIANSCSKSLAATGIRIGWLVGPPTLIQEALRLHVYMTYCQPAPLQAAVATLLREWRQHWRAEHVERYMQKRDQLANALARFGFTVNSPPGGHFIFADYSELSDCDSFEFSIRLTKQRCVTPLPGDVFYLKEQPRHVRFSFAASPQMIERACRLLS